MEAAAVIALAVCLAGAVGVLVYQVGERIDAERKAHRSELAALAADKRAQDAGELRDRAAADAVKARAELTAEQLAHSETAALLAAAQEVIYDELRKQIHATPDADLPALALRMLEERRAVLSARAQAVAAARADRGSPADDLVRRPGPATAADPRGDRGPA